MLAAPMPGMCLDLCRRLRRRRRLLLKLKDALENLPRNYRKWLGSLKQLNLLLIARLQYCRMANKALDRLTNSKEAFIIGGGENCSDGYAYGRDISGVDDLQEKNQELMKQIQICHVCIIPTYKFITSFVYENLVFLQIRWRLIFGYQLLKTMIPLMPGEEVINRRKCKFSFFQFAIYRKCLQQILHK